MRNYLRGEKFVQTHCGADYSLVCRKTSVSSSCPPTPAPPGATFWPLHLLIPSQIVLCLSGPYGLESFPSFSIIIISDILFTADQPPVLLLRSDCRSFAEREREEKKNYDKESRCFFFHLLFFIWETAVCYRRLDLLQIFFKPSPSEESR